MEVAGLHNSETEGAWHHLGAAFLHQETPTTPDGYTVTGILLCVHPVKHGADAHTVAGKGKAAVGLLTALDQPPVPGLKDPARMPCDSFRQLQDS